MMTPKKEGNQRLRQRCCLDKMATKGSKGNELYSNHEGQHWIAALRYCICRLWKKSNHRDLRHAPNIHITTKDAAQNVPAPVTTYALFRDGAFVTKGIQSDKKFLTLAQR